MMDKELATLLDATSFQVADLVGPAIVIEGAANHLLSRLPETDDHRWKVTEALGSIVAARKSLESAAESLLHIVAQDGADMLAVEVDGGAIINTWTTCDDRYPLSDPPLLCQREPGHTGGHEALDASDDRFRWHQADQCQSQYIAPNDDDWDQPARCYRDAGHDGVHQSNDPDLPCWANFGPAGSVVSN